MAATTALPEPVLGSSGSISLVVAGGQDFDVLSNFKKGKMESQVSLKQDEPQTPENETSYSHP